MRWYHKTASKQQEPCRHGSALPRWDSMSEVGHMDQVVRMYCPACGAFPGVDAAAAARAAVEYGTAPAVGARRWAVRHGFAPGLAGNPPPTSALLISH